MQQVGHVQTDGTLSIVQIMCQPVTDRLVHCCQQPQQGQWAEVLLCAAEGGPLQEWASEKGLPRDLPSICRNDEARKWVLEQLNATAKESKLKASLI